MPLSLAANHLCWNVEDVEPFHSRLFHSTENLRNAVLLDQVQMSSHFGEQIMQTLKSHLREHLVKVSVNEEGLDRRLISPPPCLARSDPSSTSRKQEFRKGPKSVVCCVHSIMGTWNRLTCRSCTTKTRWVTSKKFHASEPESLASSFYA